MGQRHNGGSESAVVGRRLCDFCSEAKAVVYCKADLAKLCIACDGQVHSTNQLFTKHTRWLLCDTCDSSPAVIFCSTHRSVLCQNCDWEAHANVSLSAGHDRRPLEGFRGCPSASELMAFLGFDEAGKKAPVLPNDDSGSAVLNGSSDTNINNDSTSGPNGENGYGFSDYLVWETPSMVSLDDLIMPRADDSSSGGHAFQAIGVPPLPKNRNSTCGQYKEEILSQIREIAKLEPNKNGGRANVEPLCAFQFLETEPTLQSRKQAESPNNNEQPALVGSNEANNSVGWTGDRVDGAEQDFSASLLGNYIDVNNFVAEKDSDAGDSSGHANESHEDHLQPLGSGGAGSFQILPRTSFREFNSQERDSAISRYREKKKNRRYDKQIRYETRKVRAESRTRIRGRFAKMEQS